MSLASIPRCQHLKVNGTQCGSPALRRNRFCFFHKRFQEETIKLNCDRARRGQTLFFLPVLEDANSIQVSLMQIMRLLASGEIDSKIASLMLYALQTATLNIRHLTIEPLLARNVVIDRDAVDQTSIGSYQWREEDFPDPAPTAKEKAAAAVRAQQDAAAQAQARAKRVAGANRVEEANRAGERSQLSVRPASGDPAQKKEPQKTNVQKAREKIQGMARDWITETAKQASRNGEAPGPER